MSIALNILYTGKEGSAKIFTEEMMKIGSLKKSEISPAMNYTNTIFPWKNKSRYCLSIVGQTKW